MNGNGKYITFCKMVEDSDKKKSDIKGSSFQIFMSFIPVHQTSKTTKSEAIDPAAG